MKHSHSQSIPGSAIPQHFVDSLSRISLPFESMLLLWLLLSPVAAFYLRFPLDQSLITFDRAVVCALLLMLALRYWRDHSSPQQRLRTTGNGPPAFLITRFEIAWLILAAVALLNALWQSTNVTYAVKIAIDSFCLPLVLFHVARYQCRWAGRGHLLALAVIGLALLLFATGIGEFYSGANLFAYKGSTVFREGEVRVNGPFASDSSYAIVCLLVTLFLRLLPSLLHLRFDKSARLVYWGALAASAIATLLPLFRTVAFAMLLCWLAIEYFIHAKPRLRARVDAGNSQSSADETAASGGTVIPRGSGGSGRLISRRVVVYSGIGLMLLLSFAVWTELSGSYLIRRLASPRNLYGRLATWQTAARIAMENPVAGVGLTNYSEYFDVIFSDWQHQDVDWVGDIRAVETPHSNLLWIASELGLSGFAPYLLANFYLLAMGLRGLRRATSREQFMASGGLLALLAAYSIPGLTLQSGFYADLNLYFFFMLGLLSSFTGEPHK
jgi:hypothetical protein